MSITFRGISILTRGNQTQCVFGTPGNIWRFFPYSFPCYHHNNISCSCSIQVCKNVVPLFFSNLTELNWFEHSLHLIAGNIIWTIHCKLGNFWVKDLGFLYASNQNSSKLLPCSPLDIALQDQRPSFSKKSKRENGQLGKGAALE